ncbi:MAG: hypothetical protein Q8865_11050 [Bacillota bacterium]|nr:hypothetical protein [Bacillota bacterium]
MNEIQKKIKTTSRIVAVITKILYICGFVFLCIATTGVIWSMITPENSFMLGHVRVISPIQIAADNGVNAALFTGIADQSFFVAILILTNRIFKDISREYSPFLPKNISRMKKIAMLLFVDSIISPEISAAIGKSLSLVDNPVNFRSELFVLAIIIYCFALIFQYGADLQQQSDETL